MNKVDYVRLNRKPAGSHTCHWPGCTTLVAPAVWGCRPHWYKLPQQIRDRIWKAFKPGQEISKTPSAEYLAAANEAQVWIAGLPPVVSKGNMSVNDLFADQFGR
jgi:hypothetical protein